MKKFNKKKLPSRHTTLGPDKAPQRSFYYAMDLTEKDVAKPFVGVVSTWNEAAPCNINLMKQAQSVKKVFISLVELLENFVQLQLQMVSQWDMRA